MRPQRTLTTLAVVALLAVGCADRGGSDNEAGTNAQQTPQPAAAADFGDLKNVCQPGNPTGEPAQGVSAKEIKVGVMSDVGFTKNSEFADAAKAFTAWCNDAGGINGRKLVANVHDTKMVEVRQRITEACRDDFALVGGGNALDAMGVKERLSCLLPDFAAQPVMVEADGADLQVSTQPGGTSYASYGGFYTWLIKEAYPASASGVGVINGDSPVTKVIGAETEEALRGAGGNVVYSELYPASGVADWTPYAAAIKNKNVRGLVYNGSYSQLAKLEQALTNMNYRLDWIDTNNNAYTPDFKELLGAQALAGQNNVADLTGVYPLEMASSNPATKQAVDIFAKYAPGARLTLPAIRAISSWLLFAKSASTCGDNLTRKCVYDAAKTQTAWTGGGLQGALDLADRTKPYSCWNAEILGPDGWKAADFKPDNGAYRCNIPPIKLTGNYPKALTLADAGKTQADFK